MKFTLLLFIACLLTACHSSDTDVNNPILALTQTLKTNPSVCEQSVNSLNQTAISTQRCNWLSNYGLFGDISNNIFKPNGTGLAYQLNSELFTDYAKKQRFMFIPEDQYIAFQALDTFEFPINSVIVKVFSLKQEKVTKPVEVRLLIKRENGWIFLPYIWLEEKQDAFLYTGGYQLDTHTQVGDDQYSFIYNIPSQAQCGECHQIKDQDSLYFQAIGPKARNLNRSIEFNGEFLNQLTLWKSLNLLTGLPENLSDIDTAPNWQDDSANLQNRAKAYLDINCAHCHNEFGSAALSGLRLEYWRKSISHPHGVCNSSHGWRGGGYDIWPGRGELSSIPIRMRHTDAKDRMPPIGRSLVDEVAAKLVSDWIDSLPYENCASD